jgi:2,3-bisphosphoglycerate-independent phosphoglycerate mutase
MNKHRPIALLILDGWGYREDKAHNPTQTVATPTFDDLYETCPFILLDAAGNAVGLPDGQMGNSEVGHLHIGAGRKVPQDLTRINKAIEDQRFFKNAVLMDAIENAKQKKKAVHVIGLLSAGGVHSMEKHISAVIQLIHKQGVEKNYLHAILDGRDTPPKSAEKSLEQIDKIYHHLGQGRIASIIGRYYAMDRDKRWDRTEKAYAQLTEGKADFTTISPIIALKEAYKRGETDEFVKPTNIVGENQSPIIVENGDVIIFMNFRADRARQLSYALNEKDFQGFKRNKVPNLSTYVTLTEYDKNLTKKVIFPPITLKNTLGEYVSTQGLKQLRIAETEKYAHVTYFINGGTETSFPGEDRLLVPSPKVATYDLQPEMSAIELTDKLVTAIKNKSYDLIICNYANPDMVGHTGDQIAAEKAVSTMDDCIKRVIDALRSVNGEALITADHGNIECMYDEKHDQPHTAHTTNLVPLFYVGRKAKFTQKEGALDDIAPTLLYLLALTIPPEMTGHNLLSLQV